MVTADPVFASVSLAQGTWDAAPVFDASSFTTVLRDDEGTWTPNALRDLFIQPDTTAGAYAQLQIKSNTDKTITVYGDATALTASGKNYTIFDYHLQLTSPAIDTGTNTSGDGVVADLDSKTRGNCVTGHPGTDVSGCYDMGAYELYP
jgi:hypothetical protein